MKDKANSHVGTCEACDRKDVILHDVEMLMCMTAYWCKACIDECDAQALLDNRAHLDVGSVTRNCTCTHEAKLHGQGICYGQDCPCKGYPESEY